MRASPTGQKQKYTGNILGEFMIKGLEHHFLEKGAPKLKPTSGVPLRPIGCSLSIESPSLSKNGFVIAEW
jgi:hypothetical protein